LPQYAAKICRRLRGGSAIETLAEASFEESDLDAAVARLEWVLEGHDPENDFGVLFNIDGILLSTVKAGA